jgi:hypothetical protein
MPLEKRCGSGEASTSMPKAGVLVAIGPSRRGIMASEDACAGSSSQPAASKPELTPQ